VLLRRGGLLPGRIRSPGESVVERGQLPVEDVPGPSVGGDVVNDHHENTVLFGQADEDGPEHRVPREVERPQGFRLEERVET